MAKHNKFTGLWGVTREYGVTKRGTPGGSQVPTVGKEMQIEFEMDFDDLSTPYAVDSERNVRIPDGSLVNWIRLEVTESFVGGTDLQLGLVDSDGTVIATDYFGTIAGISGKKAGYAELIPSVAAVTAGVQGDTGPDAEGYGDGQDYTVFTVTPGGVGTFTAGECRVALSYIPPMYSFTYDGDASKAGSASMVPNSKR